MTEHDANAPARVRTRIATRLDELGMTGRAFAGKFGKGDGWVNGILTGRISLRLEHLDRAAAALKLTSGDLVREGEEAWDLRPMETRLIRALRFLPFQLQDQVVTLTEYLVGVTPDEVELLRRLRTLDEEERSRLFHGLDLLELMRPAAPKTRAIADPHQKQPENIAGVRRTRR